MANRERWILEGPEGIMKEGGVRYDTIITSAN